MQLEKQCCTLEQAKTLKELGIHPSGEFFYDRNNNLYIVHRAIGFPNRTRLSDGTLHNGTTVGDFFPALTIAELSFACVDCICGHASNGKFYATPDEYAGYDIDSVIQDEPLPDPLPCYLERDTQAEALADLLIWLLKTELLTVDEVNERLNKA